jgi:hypothetical protein
MKGETEGGRTDDTKRSAEINVRPRAPTVGGLAAAGKESNWRSLYEQRSALPPPPQLGERREKRNEDEDLPSRARHEPLAVLVL